MSDENGYNISRPCENVLHNDCSKIKILKQTKRQLSLKNLLSVRNFEVTAPHSDWTIKIRTCSAFLQLLGKKSLFSLPSYYERKDRNNPMPTLLRHTSNRIFS